MGILLQKNVLFLLPTKLKYAMIRVPKVPLRFYDKLKSETQTTILIFVFNTNNGNGNSTNCPLLYVLSIFILGFIFSVVSDFYKKKKTVHIFIFFIGKMKNEIQLKSMYLKCVQCLFEN